MLEQVLAITVGLADTIMVSSCGEAAVSGVSLVDMINVLIINIFAALATGGAVVVAQLLGARDNKRACDAAKQLYLVVTVISLAISALIMAFREPLLRLLFGTISDSVMQSALTYLTVSVFSYPVLAIYNAGAALFRAQGNSRVSMLIAGLINIVNLIGNSIMIFGLKWGVAGAATSSVISRGTAAALTAKEPAFEGRLTVFESGDAFRVGETTVRSFATPHDAADSVGYILENGRHRFGFATDLGFVPQSAAALLRGCETVVLESNHDPHMLQAGPYPYALKQRVAGPNGHLSNPDCAVFAAFLADNGTRKLVLAHLSEKNNMPALALQQTKNALRGREGCTVCVAPRDCMESPVVLGEEETACLVSG